ncbi:MAG: DNA recombination protein RmuC [Bacteroidales bacterium]|nr:DNA recombination protein RmuC [Bacteroidales bacterium]
MTELFLVFSTLAGIIAGYILGLHLKRTSSVKKEKYDRISEELQKYRFENESLHEKLQQKEQDFKDLQATYNELNEKNSGLKAQLSSMETRLENFSQQLENTKNEREAIKKDHQTAGEQIQELNNQKSQLQAQLKSTQQQVTDLKEKNEELNEQYKSDQQALRKAHEDITYYKERNENLKDRLDTQKKELEDLGKQFKDQFKVLADNILEEKTKKFTEQNKEGLKNILDPLGKNIEDFRKKVEETYDKESKERFSLNDRIKELMELNNKISEEASNLTNALKSDTKKQGNWGEMILETILENSGLRKNEEYFVQTTMRTEEGKTIKDDQGHRMQPDVIIKYPDKRNVIIDSKVSLVAYERYVNATDATQQGNALKEHIRSLRSHVDNLSSKNYQNYTESLDFVMLFIPIEPAYLVAIREDDQLWNYAYNKRILLISPTNLIAALKLLEDLWKREYQNQNAMDIAERGGKLYDKFYNFVSSLENIGKHIDATNKSYDQAMKQLSTGSGNLIRQVEELNKLGVKTQKQLPNKLFDQE